MMKFRFAVVLCFVFSSVIAQTIDVAKVIDSVYCEDDASQSYALYLPSDYTLDSEWPIIFVFEPAARGLLPVEQFRSGAEELGYIIIASNNSKNGSWSVANNAANAIIKDGFKRFSIDSKRVYVAGFSGGSRVASAIAVETKLIAGVIGCGAGFSSDKDRQPSSIDEFVYVGIVGEKDMNLIEHLDLRNKLNSLDIENNLILFPLGHQWPEAAQLKEAMMWLDLQAVKKGILKSSKFQSDLLYGRMLEKADSLNMANRKLNAYDVFKEMSDAFEGLANINAINSSIELLESDKKFKKLQKKRKKLMVQERRYRLKIAAAFEEFHFTKLQTSNDSTLKNKSWWYHQLDSLSTVKKSQNTERSNLAYRCANLIWAKFATSSFNYESIKDYQTAINLNDVWLHAQPNYVWPLWNMAKLYALNKNVKKSIEYLYKAHDSGMKFKKGISDPAFEILSSESKFITLQQMLNESPN